MGRWLLDHVESGGGGPSSDAPRAQPLSTDRDVVAVQLAELSTQLTDEVGEHNMGLNIQAADVSEIHDAFEKIAGAMSGGAAG